MSDSLSEDHRAMRLSLMKRWIDDEGNRISQERIECWLMLAADAWNRGATLRSFIESVSASHETDRFAEAAWRSFCAKHFRACVRAADGAMTQLEIKTCIRASRGLLG